MIQECDKLEMTVNDIILTSEKIIGTSQPCFIIAEIGQNHQGDIEVAKKLILTAKECGADCVKFQKSSLPDKFNQAALHRPYSSIHSYGKTYGEHKMFLEFSNEEFLELQNYSKEIGILFTASGMDPVSIDFLGEMDVPFIKIGSGDADNFYLLKQAALKQCPLVISTGMQSMETVKVMYETVKNVHSNFVLMHCVSSYPTPPEEVNLNTIKLYQKEFPDIHIGYSGHELGTAISLAAVALGAKVLERHFTLNKNWKGSDHICSLEPDELKQLINDIRMVEKALGYPVKLIQPSENACIRKLGKSLVATRDIKIGETMTDDCISIKVAEPSGIRACDIKLALVHWRLTKSSGTSSYIVMYI
ncbi:N-acetylneuraminic acid synthase isoform X2 [Lycorma delicatula]|uniref:N-acetylneuraminic acid synthase isoform X2 n=1 Tax=Lycorma delicatula TaxID=130591 RepID=UPI003F50E517